MELAELPWSWPPDREPRPHKLMLRQQQRVNDLRAQRRDNAVFYLRNLPQPLNVIRRA